MDLIFLSQICIVNSLFWIHLRYKYIIWLMIYWSNCKETTKKITSPGKMNCKGLWKESSKIIFLCEPQETWKSLSVWVQVICSESIGKPIQKVRHHFVCIDSVKSCDLPALPRGSPDAVSSPPVLNAVLKHKKIAK